MPLELAAAVSTHPMSFFEDGTVMAISKERLKLKGRGVSLRTEPPAAIAWFLPHAFDITVIRQDPAPGGPHYFSLRKPAGGI